MPARNTANEQPGTRYGKRVVLSTDRIVIGQTKYVALLVRCDCGRVDLVRKSMLVRGSANQRVECKADERSAVMIDQWAQRKRGMNRENRV